jgi:hypothetical protein
MTEKKSHQVFFELEDALIHDAHTGFREDYQVIHSLLRMHKPKSIFEIGTNIGSGINVMARALPEAKIFSLDLDYETMKLNSKQYPIGPQGQDRVGSAAKVPYTQLRGDSLTFDYSAHPCEAYFCDGEHDEHHPYIETLGMLSQLPELIIYHDADIKEVYSGITKAFAEHENGKKYNLVRVIDTRILYALKKK